MGTMIWLKIAVAALVSGSLFGLVAVVVPVRPSQPFIIQISDWPGDQVLTLIEPMGLLPAGSGVRLDIRRAAPTRDPLDAFRAGLADAVVIDLGRLPELFSDDIRVIYATDTVTGGGGLVTAPGVVGGAALRGGRIGITFGGSTNSLLRGLLDRAGVHLQDVTLMALTPDAAAAAALRLGRVGAVAALAPSEIAALQRIPGTALLASTQDLAGAITHVLVVHEGRIPELRPAMEAVVGALAAVVESCRKVMERCLESVAHVSGRPANEWRQDFEAVRWLDRKDNLALFTGGNAAPLAVRLRAAQGGGGRWADPARPAMEWMDLSFLQAAGSP